MKYTSLRTEAVKLKHIDAPSKGIDMSKGACDIGEDYLSFAKNMVYENGCLSTRKGLFTRTDSILDTSMCDGAESYEYSVTDSTVNIDGDTLRIAKANVKYDNSTYFVFVYGIDKNQNARSLGYMHFGRVDDSTFYCPENIVIYSGKPKNGGGIFALITLRNAEDTTKTEYEIYEVDQDFECWNRNSDFYIPTVYINGRGNAYESLHWSFSSSPSVPESRNLLNSSFYAYYSSDGASSGFRLPFTDIDNSPIICRIYYGIDRYTEWIISGDEASATQAFYGVDVTVNADREKGMIYFTTVNGNYPIPIISAYSENNIRILAQKTIENGLGYVVSSKGTAAYGNKHLFYGGEERNRIYYADYETPLYFPQVFDNEIGMPDAAVTEIKILADRIIAFKSYEMYEITVKNGGNFNTTSLLADNGAFFKKADTFSVKPISVNVGCKGSTAAVCGENLIWLGVDGNIYSLPRSGSNTEIISVKAQPILEMLISENRLFSSAVGENYILSSASKAIIINSDGSCYYWELPDSIITEGLVTIGDSLSLVYRYNNNECCYIAGLEGDCDILIYGKGDTLITESVPIQSEFTLKCFDFNSVAARKSVKSVDLNLDAKGKCKIKVGDGRVYAEICLEQPKSLEETVRFITDITGLKHIEIAVSSNKGISFGGADIYYTV